MHLTDFYLSVPEAASGENIVQTANRISGTYIGQPTLRLWTSKKEWDLVEKKQDEIDQIYLLLSQHPSAPSAEEAMVETLPQAHGNAAIACRRVCRAPFDGCEP